MFASDEVNHSQMDDVAEILQPRIDRITKALVDWLPEHGMVLLPIDQLSVPVDVWRAAARRAGRIMGRPIRTKVDAYGGISAWIADWPRDEHEHDLQRAEQRRLATAIQDLLRRP